MLIPIGTDVRPRRPPVANWALVIANIVIFLFTDAIGGDVGLRLKSLYTLDAARPQLFQYLTYQFLHGDVWHLVGNMIFLWVFGNAVCDRMGAAAYVLFYLAGGICSAAVFASQANNPIVGASGAIAAVTTAFLVLFPRVHITMFVWFFVFMTTFEIPALLLITFKIILWDNVIAPTIGDATTSNVAYSAHLGGYTFGFVAALALLLVRALPRNQFDLLALWGRWQRRSGLPTPTMFGGPRAVAVEEMHSRPLDTLPLTPLEKLRAEILDLVAEREIDAAADGYRRLATLDPDQVLPRTQQLEIANHLTQSGRTAEAAHAYEAYLAAYPTSPDANEVRLLLGLMYSRYVANYDRAIHHLRLALEGLTLQSQRLLAEEELRIAEERRTAAGDTR